MMDDCHGNHSKLFAFKFNSTGQIQDAKKDKTIEDYLVSMEEIIYKLNTEDKTLRNTRRTLGFSQIVQKDLIPMIINIQDNTQVFEHTIRLLNNLTIPVECLLSVNVAKPTASEQIVVAELNSFLYRAKEAFLDTKATKAILDHIKALSKQEMRMEQEMSKEDCEAINGCLMLLRNILHIPEPLTMNDAESSPVQNQILWLGQVADSTDDIQAKCKIEDLAKDFWVVTMVQLIALIYKDQQVGTLQRLLGNWLESSPSDSSEDDESNTSPHDSGCSASASTSELNSSDSSSDTNSKNRTIVPCNNHRKNSNGGDATPTVDGRANGRQSPQKERKVLKHFHERDSSRRSSRGSVSNGTLGSDHGYYAPEKHDNASSNDDDEEKVAAQSRNNKLLTRAKSGSTAGINGTNSTNKMSRQSQHHVKTPYCPTMTDKNDMRKRKLALRQKAQMVRFNKAWKLRVKGLKHVPADDDISNLLKDFTVDFLLKGYSGLVLDLKAQLMLNTQTQLDQSHFLWLITYFLKFANQLEMELHLIGPVLSCEIISYLTYEGVNTCEQLEKAWHKKRSELSPHLRRIHLVVTAIKEFIQTLETYNRCCTLSFEDLIEIQKTQDQICGLHDLRQLFLLLIRYYNPAVQSINYLQDLVVTNHVFLLLVERVIKGNTNNSSSNNNNGTQNLRERFDMSEHIKQFATHDIMKQYGSVLEGFQTNSEYVNDCVFTMLHHVAGDMSCPECLFQPVILRCFLKIWENDYKVMDDWMDLMEFVIHKFMASTNKKESCQSDALSMESRNKINNNAKKCDCSNGGKLSTNNQELDFKNLYFNYLQCEHEADTIGKMIEIFAENGIITSRNEIVQQLLTANLITKSKSESLIEVKEQLMNKRGSIPQIINSFLIDDFALSQRETNLEIVNLTSAICKEDHRCHLQWLQRLLLEACYVKLEEYKGKGKKQTPPEPVILNYSLKRQSIPIVPYSEDQERALQSDSFNQLLQKLGFHLPVDVDKIFPRIPCFWTADVLLTVARKLGPITSDMLKFDPNLLCKSTELTYPEELPTILGNAGYEQIAKKDSTVTGIKINHSLAENVKMPFGGFNWMNDALNQQNHYASDHDKEFNSLLSNVPISMETISIWVKDDTNLLSTGSSYKQDSIENYSEDRDQQSLRPSLDDTRSVDIGDESGKDCSEHGVSSCVTKSEITMDFSDQEFA